MTCTINVKKYFSLYLNYFLLVKNTSIFKADPFVKEHKLANGLIMGRKTLLILFFLISINFNFLNILKDAYSITNFTTIDNKINLV